MSQKVYPWERPNSNLRPVDVLCGRGNGVNQRKGNRDFRDHVDALKAAYAAAKRQDKMNFAKQIVKKVQSSGGRFMRAEIGDDGNEIYVEVGYERAVEKACQALREDSIQTKKKKREMAKKSSKSKSTSRKAAVTSGTSGFKKKRPNIVSEGKTKPPEKQGKTEQKNIGDGNRQSTISGAKKSNLWQAPSRRSSGNGRKSENSIKGDRSFDDTEPPEMDESTESDIMSGTEDDDVSVDAEAYYNRFHESLEGLNRKKPGDQANSSKQSPPTHRLMMQISSPKKQLESSGWFCDFMNGGTCDSTAPENQTCWESLFHSLVQFKEVHGHCAIPPSPGSPRRDSSREEREHARLADWASLQRQVYRNIQNGRRSPTGNEKTRFQQLKAIGFVFDYNEWHWDKRYDELMKYQEIEKVAATKKARVESENTAKVISDAEFRKCLGLALWVKEQRQLFLDGLQGRIQPMRQDRVEKLMKINFSWATDLQEKIAQKTGESKMAPLVDVVASSKNMPVAVPGSKPPSTPKELSSVRDTVNDVRGAATEEATSHARETEGQPKPAIVAVSPETPAQ